jgi:hypothetical protein
LVVVTTCSGDRIALRHSTRRETAASPLLLDAKRRDQEIAGAQRQLAAGRRGRRRHCHRTRQLHGLRLTDHAGQLVEFSGKIEPLARRKNHRHDLVPFEALLVVPIMLGKRMTEHLELALVPAGDDVSAGRGVGHLRSPGKNRTSVTLQKSAFCATS